LRGKWEHADALVNYAGMGGLIGRVWENHWREWQAGTEAAWGIVETIYRESRRDHHE
jgi:hypothetical protein